MGALFSRRFLVDYKLNLTADDGFAAAARARVFVPSGGGFSALLLKMVRAEGRTVVRGGCPLFAADFAGLPADSDEGAGIAESPRGWLMPVRMPVRPLLEG